MSEQEKPRKAPNPTDRHVGSKVKARRLMLGLSQEALGKYLGLTFQQVQKYERGTNRIGASRLLQLAGVLNVRVDYFFQGLDDPTKPPDTGGPDPNLVYDFVATPSGMAATMALTKITDLELRAALVRLLETIAARFPLRS